MLRMVVSGSAAAAMRYHTSGLLNGDYYGLDAMEVGTWGGSGAIRVALSGPVQPGEFGRLCRNSNPSSGEPLTARTKANRRVGYDINFHCPKCVSVLRALTGNPTIPHCFRTAIADTMNLVEGEAKTRVRIDGAQHDRPTGNLAWATFIHTTTRPVGGIPDRPIPAPREPHPVPAKDA